MGTDAEGSDMGNVVVPPAGFEPATPALGVRLGLRGDTDYIGPQRLSHFSVPYGCGCFRACGYLAGTWWLSALAIQSQVVLDAAPMS